MVAPKRRDPVMLEFNFILRFSSLGVSKKNSLTFLVVAQLVSLRAKQIKQLDLSRTSIVSDTLSMLAITKHLDLESVVLENCR